MKTYILLGEEAGSVVLVVLYTEFGNSVFIDQTGADSFVLSAARFAQRIPLREGMIQRVLSDDRKFSWSQSPMGTAELDAP